MSGSGWNLRGAIRSYLIKPPAARWLGGERLLQSILRTSRAGILRRHVDAEPAAASWSRLLAAALQNFGDVEFTLNAVDQARAVFQESCDIRRKLLAVQPGDSTLQAELGVSHDRLGNVLVAQGKLEDAVVAYRSELDIAKRLIAQDPSNAQWISQLGSLAYVSS